MTKFMLRILVKNNLTKMYSKIISQVNINNKKAREKIRFKVKQKNY